MPVDGGSFGLHLTPLARQPRPILGQFHLGQLDLLLQT